jgi:hypothetical protein
LVKGCSTPLPVMTIDIAHYETIGEPTNPLRV